MRVLKFITILLLYNFSAMEVSAQNTAQATMKVSVEVVEAVGVNVEQPEIVEFLQTKEQPVAKLFISGSKPQDLLMDVTQRLMLQNKDGQQLNMQVRKVLGNEGESSVIELKGAISENIIQDIYSGVLTATVEYF